MTVETTEATGTGLRAGLPTELPEWRIAVPCRGCGRWLTDPRSVALGIGPSCARQEASK